MRIVARAVWQLASRGIPLSKKLSPHVSMQLRKFAEQHLGFLLLYWAAGFLAWLLFTDTYKRWELLFGGAAALLCAVGAEAARSAGVAEFRPKLSWILESWRLPWYLVQGCVQILWVVFKDLVKPEPSVLRSVVYDPGGDDGGSAARRALTVTYTTMPPNFVILDIDRDKRAMVVHQVSETPTPIMTKHLGAKS